MIDVSLTPKQKELLAVLLPREISPAEAAAQMLTSPQAAGRVMARLAHLQLTMYDLPTCGNGAAYVWCLTSEGEEIAKLDPEAGFSFKGLRK